jgi:hypothetical protein
MDDLSVAYYAGIMDSDGHIGVNHVNKKLKRPGVAAVISITNRHRGILEEVQSSYGGGVHKRCSPSINKNWTQTYNWYCKGSTALEFLKAIYPHLRIKRRQAELAMEVLSLTANRETFRIGEDERNRRDAICAEMKVLNSFNKPKEA